MIYHTHDAIRTHLQKRIRPDPRPTLNEDPSKGDRLSLSEMRISQWSPLFELYMRNRLIVGACRYETFDEKRHSNKYKILESIRKRLTLYEHTGNQEHLVDCANLLMIEFECPTHPNPHFSPLEDVNKVEKHE